MKKITVEHELFSYDELEDAAQENAGANWYRRAWDDFEFHMEVYVEDWPEVLKALGFTQNTTRVPLMSGKMRTKPDFHCSFGGGPEYVSFDGTWMARDYNRTAVEALKQDRATDKALHEILDDMYNVWVQAGQDDLYTIKGETDRRGWVVDLEERAQDDDGEELESEDVSDRLLSLCHDLDSWMTKQVNSEMDYQTGLEALKEWATSETEDSSGCVFLANGETF